MYVLFRFIVLTGQSSGILRCAVFPRSSWPRPDTAVSPRCVYHYNVKPLLSTDSEHCPDQHQDAVCQVKTGTAIDSKGLQEVAET